MRFNPIALTDHFKRWVEPVPAGAVCTHRKGCCEGLVCATSHINPNYQVCIPGEVLALAGDATGGAGE